MKVLILAALVAIAISVVDAGYPPIIERSEWGAAPPKRVTRMNVFGIVIHHTSIPNRSHWLSSGSAARMRSIQSIHQNSNGWRDIGYHFVIPPDGDLYRGVERPDHLGTHTGGANTGRVGICVGGNFQGSGSDPLGDKQYQTLIQTVAAVAEEFSISLVTYPKGHRDFKSTSCPGSVVYNKLSEIKARAIGGPEGGPSPGPTPDCTSGLPAATHGSCTDGKNSGRCMNTSTCSNAGHTFKSNLCPGNSSIRCCFNSKCGCNENYVVKDPTYNANCASGGRNGVCINTGETNCPGTIRRGLCPGPSAIRCCFSNACVLQPGAQAAAGLGIMAATAGGVGGFYYNSKRKTKQAEETTNNKDAEPMVPSAEKPDQKRDVE